MPVGVAAIALSAKHATVAFARRALYDQSAERRLEARLTVGALVEQCGKNNRAVRCGRKPVVVEDLGQRVKRKKKVSREIEKQIGQKGDAKSVRTYLERGVLAPNSAKRARCARIATSIMSTIRPDRAAETNTKRAVRKIASLWAR